MAKKPSTERLPDPPVDDEDDDRRLNPQADTEPASEPAPSAQQDEHRGLAARILDVRRLVESHRQVAIKERAEDRQRMAYLEQSVATLTTRIDREVEAIQKMQRDLQSTLHQAGEQVRQAGALARKIQGGMEELEELRAVASDPHEVVKPLQRAIGQLKADIEALGRTIDIRFEQMPRQRAPALESRGEDEDAIAHLVGMVKKLNERMKALETAN